MSDAIATPTRPVARSGPEADNSHLSRIETRHGPSTRIAQRSVDNRYLRKESP